MLVCFALLVVVVDLFLSTEMRATPLVLIFLAAKAQAEMAAVRFLREGLRWPEAPSFFNEEKLKAPPVQKRAQIAKKKIPSQRPKPQEPKKDSVPQKPNFQGKPHEVLGINENAATGVIVHAFRHWIKEYHPDTHPAPNANAKTRQLNSAKAWLLDRRKRLRSAA